MALWGNGGYVLGALTALMGRQGIWICTAAVEEAVHRHLDEQLGFLQERDPKLHQLIADIQREELSHLDQARRSLTSRGMPVQVLQAAISIATDIAIWLSTWG